MGQHRPAMAQEKVPIGLIATILKRWIAIESFETERLSAKIYRLDGRHSAANLIDKFMRRGARGLVQIARPTCRNNYYAEIDMFADREAIQRHIGL